MLKPSEFLVLILLLITAFLLIFGINQNNHEMMFFGLGTFAISMITIGVLAVNEIERKRKEIYLALFRAKIESADGKCIRITFQNPKDLDVFMSNKTPYTKRIESSNEDLSVIIEIIELLSR